MRRFLARYFPNIAHWDSATFLILPVWFLLLVSCIIGLVREQREFVCYDCDTDKAFLEYERLEAANLSAT